MSEPTFYVEPSTGIVTVDWNGPKPESVLVSTESLEAWIRERNAIVVSFAEQERLQAEQERLQAEQERLQAEQQAKIEGMESLLSLLRLGRRPNKADWDAAGVLPLMARKSGGQEPVEDATPGEAAQDEDDRH